MKNKEICSCGSVRALTSITVLALFLATRIAPVLAYSTSVNAGGPYLRGQVVTISGSVTEPQTHPIYVSVKIRPPVGQTIVKQPLTGGPGNQSWSTSFTLKSDDPTGTWNVEAQPEGGDPATTTFLVQALVTATTTTTIINTVSGTTTAVQTASGDVTVPTVVTRLSVTTVTTPTTSTSFLRGYTTSTATVTVAESTITASTEVTEMSAGTYVTVTQIVIIVGQTKSYIVETLMTSSTEATTSTILVPGTTETRQTTVAQTSFVLETTKVVNYLLVVLAFATPALLFGWALIIFRRRL